MATRATQTLSKSGISFKVLTYTYEPGATNIAMRGNIVTIVLLVLGEWPDVSKSDNPITMSCAFEPTKLVGGYRCNLWSQWYTARSPQSRL